jgi:hypothetical protein
MAKFRQGLDFWAYMYFWGEMYVERVIKHITNLVSIKELEDLPKQ